MLSVRKPGPRDHKARAPSKEAGHCLFGVMSKNQIQYCKNVSLCFLIGINI